MERTTLLQLKNDCLRHIFKFLELRGFVSLAQTNSRLLHIASNMNVHRFHHIRIVLSNIHGSEQFFDMLEVIGENILSIQIERLLTDEHFLILKSVREQCKNLTSMTLRMCEKAINLVDFRNLKELKFFQVKINSNELKNYFTINQNIESIAWDFSGKDFMDLLKMLPKLNSLSLLSFMHPYQLQYHLLGLFGLTKLSFLSTGNCDNLLIELANKFKLVELSFRSDANVRTYHIIQSFGDLESLSTELKCFPKIFPPSLKRIEFKNMDVTCSALLSLMNQLRFMEEFYLINGVILWDLDDSNLYDEVIDGDFLGAESARPYHLLPLVSFRDRTFPDGFVIFSRIEDKLREEQRFLQIILCDIPGHGRSKCIYNSDHLKVIRSSSASVSQEPVTFYPIRNEFS